MIRRLNLLIFCLISLTLSACSLVKHPSKDGPPLRHVDVSKLTDPVPKYEPKSRYGNPRSYVALGKRYYVLKSAQGYDERGIASWYGRKFHGQLTSSREPYNMFAMTAASPVLPIPCYVRVTNLENGRSAIVRVNDRGPFAPNRIIDLSYAAAKKLGYEKKGTAMVEVAAVNIRNPGATLTPVIAHKPQLYLQVGAFGNYLNAKKLKKRLQPYTNKTIRITRKDNGVIAIYRVRIGPLIGVGESDTLFNKLHQHGIHTAITIIA